MTYASTFGMMERMSEESAIVEIRIPTYRRPDLLRRALSSLIAQTHAEWSAIVFDDSPDKEGEAVVVTLNDSRIRYSPNPANLGMERNMNQAFRKTPYFENARYFCVLEDDNYYLPPCLSANVAVMEQSGCLVMLRNQRSFYCDEPGKETALETTTLSRLTEGRYPAAALIPHIPTSTAISNGALFWDRDCRTDFEIHFPVVHPMQQETLRAWFLQDDFYFAAEPLTMFNCVTQLWKGPVRKQFNRQVNRSYLSLFSRALNALDAAGMKEAERIAKVVGAETAFRIELIRNLRWPHGASLSEWCSYPQILLKSWVLKLRYPDPYAELFRQYPRPLGMSRR